MENVFFQLASASVTERVAFVLTFNNGSDAGESILGPGRNKHYHLVGPAVIHTTILVVVTRLPELCGSLPHSLKNRIHCLNRIAPHELHSGASSH